MVWHAIKAKIEKCLFRFSATSENEASYRLFAFCLHPSGHQVRSLYKGAERFEVLLSFSHIERLHTRNVSIFFRVTDIRI